MKKIINILILIALLVIIGLKLKGNKEIVENRIYQYDKEKPIKVFTQKIALADVDAKQEFTGTFEANKEVKVNADVQGKIVKYYVDEGAKVRKGQPLVKLDASLLYTSLEQVNVQIETLQKDLARYQILADADAIPAVKLEKVQQGIKTAKTQKQAIQTKIAKTTIKAPFTGIVTMKFQEVGAFAAPGVPLVLLTDIGDLKFTINVPERNLDLFKKGKAYTIKSDVYPNLNLKGKVIRIGSKGNMSNSFPVQFAIKNTKDKKLKSKMFGKVTVDTGADGIKAIVIPAKAIVGSEIEPQVYVVKDGKAVLTNVTIGKRFGNNAVINSGISEGDTIVTSGFINLFNGANVIN
jgi:RND family efflux transporter MFP subunit